MPIFTITFSLRERGISYRLLSTIFNDDLNRSLMYPYSRILLESHITLGIKQLLVASLGIPYNLWDKNAIGRRRWNIDTLEREICYIYMYVMIEMATFKFVDRIVCVEMWSWPYLPIDELISVRSKIVAFCPWSQVQKDPSDRGHFKLRTNIIDIHEMKPRCYFFFRRVKKKNNEFRFEWVENGFG